MKNILITGANGQLGSEIRNIASRCPQLNFHFTDIPELDISNKNQVDAFVCENKIDGIINCAAYTAVDRAEEEMELAHLVNEKGTDVLSQVANKYQIRLIHISTDYVFDGNHFAPYQEGDLENPVGAYGRSKLAGEKAVITNFPEAIIVRTSWLYSSHGNNFVKTMKRLMTERDSIGVIFDQVGTPTYAANLAVAVVAMLNDPELKDKGGIYHYSNEGAISWYDFAMAIKEIEGLNCRVNPLKTGEYPTKTKRPAYSVLDKSKIKKAFGLEIPYWKDSLKVCLERLA